MLYNRGAATLHCSIYVYISFAVINVSHVQYSFCNLITHIFIFKTKLTGIQITMSIPSLHFIYILYL